MKKSVLIFTITLLLGYTTTSALSANYKIEALTSNVESLQNKLNEVEIGLKNEVSETRNLLTNELDLVSLRIEKIEK